MVNHPNLCLSLGDVSSQRSLSGSAFPCLPQLSVRLDEEDILRSVDGNEV
jgi:hypothetical protein